MNKEQLLDKMRAGRSQWEGLLAEVGEERMTTPGVEGEWSIKDIVAHVGYFEGELVPWLQGLKSGGSPPPSEFAGLDVHQQNALVYERYRGQPLRDVLEGARRNWERLIEATAALPEESVDDAERTAYYMMSSWGEKLPAWQCIASDSYEHYDQHIPEIRAWLQMPPRDKADLAARIRRSRRELEAALAGLSNEQLGAPGPDGGWSIKDHLVHLADWENSVTAKINGRPAYEGLGVDESVYRSGSEDLINAALYERSRAMTVPEALDAFHRTHADLMAAMATLPAMDLTDLDAASAPGDPRRLAQSIIGNTYDHFAEHLNWMRPLIPR